MVPQGSPLRNAHSLFWSIRTNDEGVYRANSFHGLVNAGQIELVAPARVQTFGNDGRSVVLNNGKEIPADVVVLATGYTSSWSKIFDGVSLRSAPVIFQLHISVPLPRYDCRRIGNGAASATD